jgi:S-adenosylmethionine:diacylglycerol 3-amino-3-carboxypropyl transferase
MGIVFTRAWEDDRLDAELLAIGPGQRALVVAGAGDAALALAAGGGSVIAVDRNPDQLRLSALKLAAAGPRPSASTFGARPTRPGGRRGIPGLRP